MYRLSHGTKRQHLDPSSRSDAPRTNLKQIMNTQIECWIAPDFEEIPACMECTAYAEVME